MVETGKGMCSGHGGGNGAAGLRDGDVNAERADGADL